jgi:hypothetical protein
MPQLLILLDSLKKESSSFQDHQLRQSYGKLLLGLRLFRLKKTWE